MKKKNAVFCGAARGLGNTIAQVFLEADWNVIILDLTLNESQPKMHFYQCDLSDFETVKEVIKKTLTDFGSIDALINCVRYRKKQGIELSFSQEWKKALEIDLHTYFNTSSLVCESMKEKGTGCSIVNISSVVSELVTLKETISYHTAKAAINQMTRYLALQYGPYNIRANTVLPGLISNQQSEKSSDAPDASLYSKYARHVPLQRSGAPREVADLVLFLASSNSSFITGQNIVIDGGLNMCEHLGILKDEK